MVLVCILPLTERAQPAGRKLVVLVCNCTSGVGGAGLQGWQHADPIPRSEPSTDPPTPLCRICEGFHQNVLFVV